MSSPRYKILIEGPFGLFSLCDLLRSLCAAIYTSGSFTERVFGRASVSAAAPVQCCRGTVNSWDADVLLLERGVLERRRRRRRTTKVAMLEEYPMRDIAFLPLPALLPSRERTWFVFNSAIRFSIHRPSMAIRRSRSRLQRRRVKALIWKTQKMNLSRNCRLPKENGRPVEGSTEGRIGFLTQRKLAGSRFGAVRRSLLRRDAPSVRPSIPRLESQADCCLYLLREHPDCVSRRDDASVL